MDAADQNLIPPVSPHAMTAADVCAQLGVETAGLSAAAVDARLARFGRNELPRRRLPGPVRILFRQFLSPLIYILLFATVLSLVLREWADAGFIAVVLALNAVIGAVQEYSAQRSAQALEKLVSLSARVRRNGEVDMLDAAGLVPGDIVLLESGDKIPADLRLLDEFDLELDESLLTGESFSAPKDQDTLLARSCPVADRTNMVFAGTLVLRGRATGVVVATGEATELGKIAEDVQQSDKGEPPLVMRMKQFTARIGLIYIVAVLALAVVAWLQGSPLLNMLIIAVALAVAAIPEGLPVAITVALSVAMTRMSRVNVIIRRLVAVEALGSCTLIAADKTGTLTVNELMVAAVQLPEHGPWTVSGEGRELKGQVYIPASESLASAALLTRLARASVLSNEAFLEQRNGHWVYSGDPVDVALLVMAWKSGCVQADLAGEFPQLARIAFESEHMYAASLNRVEAGALISIKGAPEVILGMCTRMATADGDVPIDVETIRQQAEELAARGYRLLAIADRQLIAGQELDRGDFKDLCLLGLVAMIDPPREDAPAAIRQCREAGVGMVMITGDHPTTAMAIARQLGLAGDSDTVVTGEQLRQLATQSPQQVSEAIMGARVFARVEPRQKLEIVRTLSEQGHYVAVTGDGANDAPALRAAHVGVAMGKRGTEVARESAELIITDDNIRSLVDGIRQGRIAYANVRKVIYLLLSTGAVEIVLFILVLAAGMPIPLTAVQLLWLNLVTEGIQDIAVAFEPPEGDEMKRPPRPPSQPVFDRLMVERVAIAALAMGVLGFAVFWYQYRYLGVSLEEARNVTLLLMVLFENIQVFNCRSETRSIFRMRFFQNPLLLAGTIGAQLLHIGAMYTPGLNTLLEAQPVSLGDWFVMLLMVLSILLVSEVHKWWRNRMVRHPHVSV